MVSPELPADSRCHFFTLVTNRAGSLPVELTWTIISLVPRPSYKKIEKGSGQTCIEPVYVRNYSRAPIRFKNEVT